MKLSLNSSGSKFPCVLKFLIQIFAPGSSRTESETEMETQWVKSDYWILGGFMWGKSIRLGMVLEWPLLSPWSRLSLRKTISRGCLSEVGSSLRPVLATGKASEIYFHVETLRILAALFLTPTFWYFIPISIFYFKAQTGKTTRILF